MIDCDSGKTEIEMLCAGVVINFTVIGAIVMPFAVPLTVMLNVPTGVVVCVVTVKIELFAVVVFGLKVAVAPDGKFVAESVTLSAKLSRFIFIV